MANIDPFSEDDFAEDDRPDEDVKALRDELEARCLKAKFPIEVIDPSEMGDNSIRVGFPSGRDRRWYYCSVHGGYKQLLSFPFEEYVFLQGFDAFCNYTQGTIEASIRAIGVLSDRGVMSRLLRLPLTGASTDRTPRRLEIESPDKKIAITIGQPSDELSKLLRWKRSKLSILLKTNGIRQHDQSLELLRRITDALFFQIDLVYGMPMSLIRERRRSSRQRRSGAASMSPDIGFPAHEYDPAPISLYWYARSAIGMPLLQFLAFYQVIEYYFPTYSQADARRKLKGILKDPGFRGDRDADLGRLLSAIHVSRSGAFGDERSQLRFFVKLSGRYRQVSCRACRSRTEFACDSS